MKYCADMIALYDNKIILVERLSFPSGFALPGGRRDLIAGKLEESIDCAMRELSEETGLKIKNIVFFRRYEGMFRDPRGYTITDVFFGEVYGSIKNEKDKTNVKKYSFHDIPKKNEFSFDHYNILMEWYNEGGNKNVR